MFQYTAVFNFPSKHQLKSSCLVLFSLRTLF